MKKPRFSIELTFSKLLVAAVALMFFVMIAFGIVTTFLSMGYTVKELVSDEAVNMSVYDSPNDRYYDVFNRTMDFAYYIILVTFLCYLMRAFGEHVVVPILNGKVPKLDVQDPNIEDGENDDEN